ncbi:multi-sensor signal transduction histidine kinase [Dehalogenimonas lykanthroporepellens BL-DC-9]|nr:multi-sensor signal transduction histidine kinase [Dehalogenimonas lykanthroporepellens BL-DC-9]
MTEQLLRRLMVTSVITIAVAIFITGLVRGFSVTLLIAGIAAAVAVAVTIYLMVPSTTDDEAEIELALKRLGGGEAPEKVRLVAIGELADIKHAFNEMARKVGGRLKTLTAERNRMDLVLAHVGDAIFMVDKNTEITHLNDAAVRMFHLDKKEKGQTFMSAVRNHEMEEMIRKCVATGRRQEKEIESRPGRRQYSVTVTPIHNESGAVIVVRDLTNLKRLETVRRDFVANISHELRTPIASLKLLAETLKEGAMADQEVAADFLNRISVEADKMGQLVDELGELSRIESGAAPLDKRPMDAGAVMTTVVGRLQNQADRAKLTLEVATVDGLPAVRADAGRIEQVLMNLTHNAIKFTPAGGRITLTAGISEKGIEIKVTDTGAGITADDLPRIFERFYKADKARSGGGTGLGLAIAKHIVHAHGGEIRAESSPGQGTTISFTLPK